MRYDDLIDDGDSEDSVIEQISQLAHRAGYGEAVLEMQRNSASEAWGDRIVSAAEEIAGPTDGIFGPGGYDENGVFVWEDED